MQAHRATQVVGAVEAVVVVLLQRTQLILGHLPNVKNLTLLDGV